MNKLFIFVILSLITLNLKSQSFYGGVKLAALVSQVDGDNYGGYHKIAPTGGIYVRNNFSKNDNWGMSLELNYRNKGSRATQEELKAEGYSDFKIVLHYIELPIIFNFKIKRISSYKFKNDFFIEFGPSFAYLIKGTQYISRIDQNETFNKFELGLNIGLSYMFNNRWGINYRYSYSFPFTPIKKHPGGQKWLLNRGLYNNCMSLGLIFEI